MANKDTYTSYQTEEYYITEEPFYLPVADEVELFEVAYSQQMPILLKGPTGTGKTRFVCAKHKVELGLNHEGLIVVKKILDIKKKKKAVKI